MTTILAHPAVVIADRAGIPEKTFYIDVHVCDSRGQVVLQLGNQQTPVYPRSGIKLLQAVGAIESGTADHFGFSESEVALACASHRGEISHVAATKSMLLKTGLRIDHLGCGSAIPTNRDSYRQMLINETSSSALYHNCSGKHAMGLAWCVFKEEPLKDYLDVNHPLQRMNRYNMERFSGYHFQDSYALDGCSYPTWARPLSNWAQAMARIADPDGFDSATQRAVRTLLYAVEKHPLMVAGEGTFVSLFTRHFGNRVYVKNGADGVMCAAVPHLGIGIALKVRSGQKRAASMSLVAILEHLKVLTPEESLPWRESNRINAQGAIIGKLSTRLLLG